MDLQEPIHNFGEFTIGDESVFGELKVNGRSTNLHLQSHQYIDLGKIAGRFISGELPDRTKLSLINCNIPPISGARSGETGKTYFADIFPHYVALGSDHLHPEHEVVAAIYWYLPDLSTVFYDFDAFSASLSPERFIDAIVEEQEQAVGRKISVGPDPEVQFFTGRYEIFACDVGLAGFSVRHSFNQNFGGPSGIWMKNRIHAALRFHKPVRFAEALTEADRISLLLGLVVGRPQDIEAIRIEIVGKAGVPPLRIFPSLPVRYERNEGHFSPGPADVLLDGIGRPDELEAVLKYWLNTHAEMAMSRGRLWDSFKKQDYYDADRIIAVANLFDTIPDKYYPRKVALTPDIEDAAEKAKKLFKPLPKSPERESLLRELSNIAQPRLRAKVKHWAADLIQKHGDQYEDLEFVIDRAVKCRNYFVHGGKQEFSYHEEVHLLAFLTRTLEFCYVVPEFLRAGWDWKEWRRKCGVYHPFWEFTADYSANLQRLRDLVPLKAE